MLRISDAAHVLLGLYSGSTEEQLADARLAIDDPEIRALVRSKFIDINSKDSMERIRDSKSLAATTKDMRDIARAVKRLGLNQNMSAAQFKLLDPRGTHILSLLFRHRQADNKPTDIEHVRYSVSLKLLGKSEAVITLMDVPMEFIADYYQEDEIPENPYDEHVKRAEGKAS